MFVVFQLKNVAGFDLFQSRYVSQWIYILANWIMVCVRRLTRVLLLQLGAYVQIINSNVNNEQSNRTKLLFNLEWERKKLKIDFQDFLLKFQ